MDITKYPLDPDPRIVKAHSQDDELFVTIKIGNAQAGGSRVKIGDQILAKGDLEVKTSIGKAGDLQDKLMEFRTNVTDINLSTNRCVISTKITDQHKAVLFLEIDKGNAPPNGMASFIGNYIVKLSVLVCVFLLNMTSSLIAQDESFQSLETPASPGFILLDQTPSAIERPTTPQGFGVSALGLFSGAGGAMEVAPYWLTDHVNLSPADVYKKHNGLIHNFSISVSHVKQDSIGYVSFGARTRLFRSFSPEQIHQLDSLTKRIQMLSSEVDDETQDSLFEAIDNVRQQYVDLTLTPVFTIDLAMATAGASPTNSFNDLQTSRWAVWASLNWRPKGNEFYITVLSRYIGNNRFGTYADNSTLLDVGARMNYDIGKFSASLEYLQRFNLTTPASKSNDNRLAAIGSYQLSEKFYLTATFGKDFTNVNNIIAMAGINFGFSKSKVSAKDA